MVDYITVERIQMKRKSFYSSWGKAKAFIKPFQRNKKNQR